MEKPGFTSRSERGEKAKVCAKVSEKEFGTNFSLGKTGGEHLVSGFSWDAGKLDQTIVVLINTTRKKKGSPFRFHYIPGAISLTSRRRG